MSVKNCVLLLALLLPLQLATSQTVEYEILPESEFQHGFTDDSGEFHRISGNIKGLCRVTITQKEGETSLRIDSLSMTSLTDPEITVNGGGRWVVGYGSAEIVKFGLQVAALSVQATHGPEQVIATFPEAKIAWVEFPYLEDWLIGTPFSIVMRMAPAGDSIKRFFRRGDVDGDEDKDITDAMVVLLHLFQGGEAPSCQDAEDANDDGRMDVGDAVYLLNRLFLGGERSPVPSQHCGIDPTDDDLDCQGQQACITIDRVK